MRRLCLLLGRGLPWLVLLALTLANAVLRELRRDGPTVIVKKGEQVNVADKQVNVAGGGAG